MVRTDILEKGMIDNGLSKATGRQAVSEAHTTLSLSHAQVRAAAAAAKRKSFPNHSIGKIRTFPGLLNKQIFSR